VKVEKIIEGVSPTGATQILWRLSEPYFVSQYHRQDDGTYIEEILEVEHVVTSAIVVPYTGPEVLVFPADEHAEILSWSEITGHRGDLDHMAAIDQFCRRAKEPSDELEAEILDFLTREFGEPD